MSYTRSLKTRCKVGASLVGAPGRHKACPYFAQSFWRIDSGILDAGSWMRDSGYGINSDSLISCIPYLASRILHPASKFDTANNPLAETAAYKAFQAEIKDRCQELPVVVALEEVGSDRCFGS